MAYVCLIIPYLLINIESVIKQERNKLKIDYNRFNLQEASLKFLIFLTFG